MKFKIFCLILLIFVLGASVHAFEETKVEHEFSPDGFMFEYKDHNSSVYEGDRNLRLGYVNNTADNTTLILTPEAVRTLAYISRKTFKFDDSLIITRSLQRDDGYFVLLTLKYKNGTNIPLLDVKNDLSDDQKEYFDDYESDLKDYHDQQIEDLEDEYNYQQSRDQRNYYGFDKIGIYYK